ncbi:hypothetical protein P389DRAFT_198925 [Cystobasidium minutum MCA 4210]|uniref:uncharacterized protein n=1 Tax=Cystobasidium minutum MCA 4210 TaxID=1397322 RepID=UPI0034D00FB6|eukprot:jgi/Rhomi1/198925/gm1.7139_g
MADDTRYSSYSDNNPYRPAYQAYGSHSVAPVDRYVPPSSSSSHQQHYRNDGQHHQQSWQQYQHDNYPQAAHSHHTEQQRHSDNRHHDNRNHHLPPRPQSYEPPRRAADHDRHPRSQHHQQQRESSRPDDRVPPPRRQYNESWQHDRYDDREYGYGEGSSSAPAGPSTYNEGLIRFANPDDQQSQHQRHHQYSRDDFHYRRDYDDMHHHRRDSPPEHSSRYDADLPEKPRRRPRTAPNQSVILIGIPPMCDGDDVRAFIDEFKPDPSDPSPVEDVTIVMDKQTGMSKRFGFVRFITLEHARAFVEANYDHVFWKSRGSHDIVEDGVKIRIDYASDDRRPGDARPRKRGHESTREEKVPVNMNDGSKDMGSTPNNILLLRNLDPLTNEVHLATKLENLDDAARERTAKAQGPKKIILIKDRESNLSWCFAFAIFPDIDCAKAALRTILDPVAFPHGFTIQGRLAAVTFARVGCFTKAYAKTTWSFPDEGDDGKKQEYLYWDDAAYGLLYDSPAYKNALATKETEGPKTDDVDVEAFLNSLAGEGAASKSESDVVVAPPAINLSLAGVLGPAGNGTKGELAWSVLQAIDHPKNDIAVDINKWNQKKAEVAVPEPTADFASPAPSRSSVKPEASTDKASSPATTSPLSTLDTSALDYADLSDVSVPKCLLCQRQFKSLEVLQKHSKQSELHKNNLKDSSKVSAAKEAISKIPSTCTASGAVSQYRDRAMERRTALGQPDHPVPPSKRQKLLLPSEVSKPLVSAPEKEIEETNIGSKLLASMGWTSGSGLGSSAAGIAAPVQAKAFASGAGIGASLGVNASEKASETWGGKDFGRMKAAQRMAEAEKKH